jgi:hypothetical protein
MLVSHDGLRLQLGFQVLALIGELPARDFDAINVTFTRDPLYVEMVAASFYLCVYDI